MPALHLSFIIIMAASMTNRNISESARERETFRSVKFNGYFLVSVDDAIVNIK